MNPDLPFVLLLPAAILAAWALLSVPSLAYLAWEAWRAPEEPAPEPVRLRLIRGGRSA